MQGRFHIKSMATETMKQTKATHTHMLMEIFSFKSYVGHLCVELDTTANTVHGRHLNHRSDVVPSDVEELLFLLGILGGCSS